jgi:hypothetical protein|mmetsp:Transcript_87561/g.145500  ORF Transcript_87561/g.145500 Transcript_87561/m.145500 type:complete len:103 (-) Transcript_87561:216-524(-)
MVPSVILGVAAANGGGAVAPARITRMGSVWEVPQAPQAPQARLRLPAAHPRPVARLQDLTTVVGPDMAMHHAPLANAAVSSGGVEREARTVDELHVLSGLLP